MFLPSSFSFNFQYKEDHQNIFNSFDFLNFKQI